MRRGAAFAVFALLLLAAAMLWRDAGEPADGPGAEPWLDDPVRIARGAYLARAGNCQDCHTPRGAVPYSGGRGIPTPFGTVYSSNLTPDVVTGLGGWTAAQFRRALQEGRGRDGRRLAPAFPYDSYTGIGDVDADALFVYLRSLPPVTRPNRPHELRFPYNTQAALWAWRALYFRSARFVPEAAQSAEWNRGAYLVRTLGHCGACHAPRNVLGASVNADALPGGLMPRQNWLAPALGGGIAELPRLLKAGVGSERALLGPMAEVVLHSTQYLHDADLQAMDTYLRSLPRAAASGSAPRAGIDAQQLQRGERLYGDHCAGCHGTDGRGVDGAYAPLAGNRALLADPPANPVHIVLGGAFAATTAANPRPFGMPPFAGTLSDADVVAVLNWLRSAWGHTAAPVGALDVERFRSGVRP